MTSNMSIPGYSNKSQMIVFNIFCIALDLMGFDTFFSQN